MPSRPRVLVLLVCLLTLAAAADAQTTDDPPTLRVGGFIQYDYLGQHGGDETDDTFRFRRVRLTAGGTLMPKVDYLVTIEATGTPVLRDAFLRLSHLPAATIQLGQFMMPQGQEYFLFSSNTLEFTERILGPVVAGRDAGIMVSNATPFWGWMRYAAAVTNGTGMNTRDNNDAKDALLRLTATPPGAPGLQASLNVVRGDQPAGMRTRRGADVSLERKHYHLAAEFEREQWEGGPTRTGHYVFGSWRYYPPAPRPLLHHLEFGTRYARVTGGAAVRQVEFAANYYVQPNLRFMCDFIVHTDRPVDGPTRTFHARANIRF